MPQVLVDSEVLFDAINPNPGYQYCANNAPRGGESHDCSGCGARNIEGWNEPINHKPGCSYVAKQKAIAELLALLKEYEDSEEESTEPVRNPDGSLENFMISINGKNFACSCGCNVFHKPDNTRLEIYKCNSCGHEYSGE